MVDVGCLGGWSLTAPVLCPGADGVGILQPPGLCPQHMHQHTCVGQHAAARRPPRLQLRFQVSAWREAPPSALALVTVVVLRGDALLSF